jgi:WhiB family redox-sensing transcriptional regulator
VDGIRAVNNWRVNALCAEIPGDLWFSEATQTVENRKAKEICQACPVKEPCLVEALEAKIDYGIWGGLGPMERRSLKRKMKR